MIGNVRGTQAVAEGFILPPDMPSVVPREAVRDDAVPQAIHSPFFPHRHVSCKMGRTRKRRNGLEWSDAENNALIAATEIFECKMWKHIAKFVSQMTGKPERTADQCSQHWLRVLNPQLVKGKWSREEDRKLIEAVKGCPSRPWTEVARLLHGRCDTQVRYRIRVIAPELLKSYEEYHRNYTTSTVR